LCITINDLNGFRKKITLNKINENQDLFDKTLQKLREENILTLLLQAKRMEISLKAIFIHFTTYK